MPAFDLASQPATMAEHELVGTMSGMEKRRGPHSENKCALRLREMGSEL